VKRGWDGKRLGFLEAMRLEDGLHKYIEDFIERRKLVTKKDWLMAVLDD
jgi:hypothetical protein